MHRGQKLNIILVAQERSFYASQENQTKLTKKDINKNTNKW